MISTTRTNEPIIEVLRGRLGELKEGFDRAVAEPAPTRQPHRADYLVFELGREWFAWPVVNLARIVVNRRIVTLPGRQDDLYGVMTYQNRVLAVANLHHRLNLGSMKPERIHTLLISKGLPEDTAIAVERLVAIAPVATSEMAPRPISLASDTAQMIDGEFYHQGRMVTLLNPAGFSG
jgi:chemotaxis signal transduction protein